jgi:hypothetical protein
MWGDIWIAVMSLIFTAMSIRAWFGFRKPLPLRVWLIFANIAFTALGLAFAMIDTTHPPTPPLGYSIALGTCAGFCCVTGLSYAFRSSRRADGQA